MSDEYKSICGWLNAHRHGSMTDFEKGLAIVASYMPAKHNKMKLLRSDERLYDLFRSRLVELDKEKKANLQIATIQPAVVERAGDIAVKTIQPVLTETIAFRKNPSRSKQIDELEQENRLIQKNIGFKHAQLSAIGRNASGVSLVLTIPQKAQRKALRDEIVALEEKLRENWLSIQFIQIHGYLPELPKKKTDKIDVEAPKDFREFESNRKMIVYLERQIREKQAKLKHLAGEEYIKMQKTIAKQQQNLDIRIQKKKAWELKQS